MSDWTVYLRPHLGEEIASLPPDGRRAVHEALAALAADPRAGIAEPITAAELRRITTGPTPTGDRITLLYRVHEDERRLELIWIISGP
ncbi:type II toxin-antitoxin system RelE/ParE family toxin [Streptomyces sp. NPDC090442]|uniref:type II toxin-antitoxin system RelE family toxin n=1 Tax=Streptomyces sp. NPDC090442 TaxID=3365962 RepID=UPI003802C15A